MHVRNNNMQNNMNYALNSDKYTLFTAQCFEL